MTARSPARFFVLLAFLAVYVIWGSTYVGILFAIETIPPFLMAGSRFMVAGAVLYVWARFRGESRPTGIQWRSAAIVGALLPFLGNGGVVWAEQKVPSSVAALIISTTPLWMTLFEWWRPGGHRPGLVTGLGLLGGFLGVAWMVAPTGGPGVDPVGAAVLLFAACSWSLGSIYSRSAPLPKSSVLATGMEMLSGGLLLLLAGLLNGESAGFSLQEVSARSGWALGYLVVFGSIVGYSAYMWLLQVSTPARVSTYAFVNPVVAVLLGWLLAGETFTARTWGATAVIVTSVVVLILARARPTVTTPTPAPAEAELS